MSNVAEDILYASRADKSRGLVKGITWSSLLFIISVSASGHEQSLVINTMQLMDHVICPAYDGIIVAQMTSRLAEIKVSMIRCYLLWAISRYQLVVIES